MNSIENKKIFSKTKINDEYEIIISPDLINIEIYLNIIKYYIYKKYKLIKTNSLNMIKSYHGVSYILTSYDPNKLMNKIQSSTFEKISDSNQFLKIKKILLEKIYNDEFDYKLKLSNETKFDTITTEFSKLFKTSYRLKNRHTFIILQTDNEILKVDITSTKTTDKKENLNNLNYTYEIEIEYNLLKGTPSDKFYDRIYEELVVIYKILHKSNHIIGNTEKKNVLDYYKFILNINKLYLYARQPISLEIQYVEILPDKYAVTDKTDGDRYFLFIVKNKVYLISSILNIKFTGIILKNDEYDGSLFDGEYISNKSLYLMFDCLFYKQKDIRVEIFYKKRLEYINDIIEKCFVFENQTSYKFIEYSAEFNLNDVELYYKNELFDFLNHLDNNLKNNKSLLIRKKFILFSNGIRKQEIFKYSKIIWDTFHKISTPYIIDGLIYHPIKQEYTITDSEIKFYEFKWKPYYKNSIDFYIEFEKYNNNILKIFDNSKKDILNREYIICKLHVGKIIKNKEYPVLFGEEYNLHLAYIFLDNNMIKDINGNIINNKTVVEFYYNHIEPNKYFRWVPIKTRYDKTEFIRKYNRKYGNYLTTAEKIWRSIVNPIKIEDFIELDIDNYTQFDKKMKTFINSVSHDVVISSTKENIYYQKISEIAKSLRNFHNWLKSNIIYTYCNPIYNNDNKMKVLDIGCGKGGDIMKFYHTFVELYVGIDISNDGLISSIDGALSRYNRLRKIRPNFPKMFFINADATSLLNYNYQKNALNGMSSINKKLINIYFSNNIKYDVFNVQFCLHYMLKNKESWDNFKSNINKFLKNGGFMLTTHFDKNLVLEKLKDKTSYSELYNDKMLFDIKKKYDDDNITGLGDPIDIYASWMFEDGRYVTEYLVDFEYIKNDLEKSCDLELIDTDLFKNQFEIHKEFFNNIEYEQSEKTKKFFKKVKSFFDTDNILNQKYYNFSFLNRYCIFRKKEKKLLDLNDTSRFTITNIATNYSFFKSIDMIFKKASIFPINIDFKQLFSNLNINVVIDNKININQFIKNINISTKIQDNNKFTLNGINIIIFYDDNIKLYKNKLSNKYILLKKSIYYNPIYYNNESIFNINHEIISELINKIENNKYSKE